MDESLTELYSIWQRSAQGDSITEQDFLAAARWAYQAMPAENVHSALHMLLTAVDSPSNRLVH